MTTFNKELFNKELAFGQNGEKFVAKWLASKGYKILLFNDNELFDICAEEILTKDKLLVEVKTEKYDSNNIAIEYSESGKPSGISSTISDVYVVLNVNDRKLWLIDTLTLKNMCRNNMYDKKPAGQNKTARVHLIPKDDMDNYCIICEQF